MSAAEPTRLPGTVWPREGEPWQTTLDGAAVCVVEREGIPYAYRWSESHAGWERVGGRIFAAWAMAERARAEQAETRLAAVREAADAYPKAQGEEGIRKARMAVISAALATLDGAEAKP